ISLPRENALQHYGYPTIEGLVERQVRYARHEANEYFRQGRRFTVGYAFWRPMRRCLGDLILRPGFLHDMAGGGGCLLAAWHQFLIEAYLWELYQKESTKDSSTADSVAATF